MSGFNKHIEIDNYLNGILSDKELELFEAKMLIDTTFAEEVELVKLTNQVIISGAQADIKARLQNIHNQHQKEQNWRKWGLGGLSVLVLLTIIGIILNTTSHQNNTLLETEKNNDVIIIETGDTIKEVVFRKKGTHQKIKGVLNNQIISEPLVNELIDTMIIVKEEDKKNELVVMKNNPPTKTINNDPEKNIDDKSAENKVVNPCEKVQNSSLNYEIQWPCLGGKKGSFQFFGQSNNNVSFAEFSLDGGKSYSSTLETKIINAGVYELVAKDNDGCLSKAKRINVNYGNCNFVIQPNYGKYWEFNLSEELDYPVVLELRNARTAQLVYQTTIDQNENFIWEGKDLNDVQVTLGNYVYMFTSTQKGLIAQGQIAVIN